jgi:hypothetical protein
LSARGDWGRFMGKMTMAGAALALTVAAACAAPAVAGDIFVSGAGVFGPTISTLAPVEIPGDSFSFSFYLPDDIAANPTTDVTTSEFTVNGARVSDAISAVLFYPADLGGGFDIDFAGGQVVSLYVTDPSTSAFVDLGTSLKVSTGSYNFTLDDPSGFAGGGTVSLTAVPEPQAWALMVLGFGGLGATLRSSRRRAAAL